MKKAYYIIALFSLVGVALLAGCKKQEEPPATTPATPEMPATNAPAMTNAPATTNAPMQ